MKEYATVDLSSRLKAELKMLIYFYEKQYE